MKTYMATPQTAERDWYVVDAQGKTLGRLASQIAMVLRGKNKPTFTPHVDAGDFVIVVNAEKVHLTGRKHDQKMYHWYSGYQSGLRSRTAKQMLATKPEEILRIAVKGMLPKNDLSRQLLRKLKIYRGGEHPHQAQQPKAMEL